MYPWLEENWRQIRLGIDRLPPALMFVGPAGLGKLELALATARALRCPSPVDGAGCLACATCAAMTGGNDPDLHLVTTERFALDLDEAPQRFASRYLDLAEAGKKGRKPREVIAVDQVRLLIERLSTHGAGRGPRIAVIVPAAALNVNAANALLKILEEPPGDARFLLVGSGRDAVPATILSRVAVVECRVPDRSKALEWLVGAGADAGQAGDLLGLAAGAPLAARQLLDEGVGERLPEWRSRLVRLLTGELLPVAAAAGIGADAGRFLLFLETLLGDALLARAELADRASLAGGNAELLSRLQSVPVWDIIEKIQYFRRGQQRVVDEQLFLEDILLALWQKN